MIILENHLAGTSLSRAQIAKLFGVTQLRVDVFGLDVLVNTADHLYVERCRPAHSDDIGKGHASEGACDL
jgi:hypothetical protein